MDAFKKLFGAERSRIRSQCILTPLDEISLFSGTRAGSRARGDYFRVVDTPHATLIGTRYSLLVGDCVLALADTPCRDLYLFNCCGGIDVDVGTAYCVTKAFDFESFGGMLAGKGEAGCYLADPALAAEFTASSGLPGAVCATVGSLALEAAHLARFRALGVTCLDMECSAVFAAAQQAGKRALALVYASNRIPDKPWHEQLDQADIQRLARARTDLAATLLRFLAAAKRGLES